MNKSDSQRIVSLLENKNYKKTDITEADMVIVNMCSVRQSAVDRVHGLVPLLKKTKALTVLTGCILEKDRNKFKKDFDYILKAEDFQKKFGSFKKKPDFSSPPTANIPIMTGCNNFCSYCVVPYVRGKEISRSIKEIVSEAKRFIENNYKEIWLLGQNVNSYSNNFPSLLREINNIPGNFWIRFTSSHPKDFSKELVYAMKESKKATEYLNLPLQSGDNEVLKKMNRPYNLEEYEEIINLLRKEIKDISLSTDIIVGFPGETKKQFQNTAKALKRMKFDMAYISRYSKRPGTKAAELNDNVPLKEKKEREKILNKIIEKNSFSKNKEHLGKTLDVLITSKKNNFYFGKTRSYKTVKVYSPKNIVGEFVTVKIKEAFPWGLRGLTSDT